MKGNLMQTLNLKPTQKSIKTYYESLERFRQLGVSHESTVKSAFQSLLEYCCRQFGWTLVLEWQIKRSRNRRIFVDGALVDSYKLPHGFWEAKDIHDDLEKAIQRKFDDGYPKDNILFQTPERAILWQDGRLILDSDLTKPYLLIEALKLFFEYRPPDYVEWEQAVEEFKDKVPELANGLIELIRRERQTNTRFIGAFADFTDKCRQAINPNLSEQAVEEMLIQHLLTERIFRRVFNNPDFTHRNVIANEIEKVIYSLTSQSFSRDDFLQNLDRFYVAIEKRADTIDDFSQKQHFLNTVYEQFFQGFSVKVADTHGIVYTPQPIVDFMVKSVEDILRKEFGRSLSDKGVHILDPFVGTGNFIVRIMQEIKRVALQYKYTHELHCNEVMLLPYYIASMNIEHEYFELTGNYQPFEGICLVDTFDMARQQQVEMFVEENTARVEKQMQTPMFVIIGNPPYNASQVNENDNNKNRKYEVVDKRVSETYAKDSKATNKNALSDPYVKAIRWASDRIGEEGIVAFVTNNSFIDAIAFDGMRKHLASDFSKIYHINLKGNARTSGERRRREAGNVFDDMIRVSVGITFFVRKKDSEDSTVEVWIYSVDDYLTSKAKKDFLVQAGNYTNVPMKKVSIDKKYNWLTEGLHDEFETFISIGNRKAKASKEANTETIFKTYSNGVKTNRDAWAYNFNRNTLIENMKQTIEVYNEQVFNWNHRSDRGANVDDFVSYEDSKISWSGDLKDNLKRGRLAEFSEDKVRRSIYRPFTKSNLFFDRILNNRVYVFPSIFPTPEAETENRVICVSGVGSSKPFHCLTVSVIPCLDILEKTQCFPFYSYNEDGTNRRENITDWALEQFRANYEDDSIGKWDIFHYIYAVLHHPDYRERYAANLKRGLPRIPLTPDFWEFAKAGERLAKIHVFYEEQPEYPLQMLENPAVPLDWHVEKMKLSKDKTQIIYNDFLTLAGIPSEVFEYRLGNRSALEWIIDRYRVKTDKRSGIVNNPNRQNDPEYIVRLIGQVITVSLETVKIINSLPDLGV
jgi:predicted helicase